MPDWDRIIVGLVGFGAGVITAFVLVGLSKQARGEKFI